MRVLLVDDHPMFRDGVETLCARHWPRMRFKCCDTLAEALETAAATPLDLVLLDMGLPDSAGLGGARLMREACPDVPLVLLSTDEDPDTAAAALRAGANAYVPKRSQAEVLRAAVQGVIDGGIYVPDQCRGDMHALVAQRHGEPLPDDEFSPRQREVLRLLAQGLSNKAIARTLALSESTVKTHIASLFRKLGVDNRTQAVVAASQRGLRLAPGGAD